MVTSRFPSSSVAPGKRQYSMLMECGHVMHVRCRGEGDAGDWKGSHVLCRNCSMLTRILAVGEYGERFEWYEFPEPSREDDPTIFGQ